ncbi:MAG: peptidase and chymotrypsin/Hap, partial [Thermoleophilia bacterium]|nr:peptidase and chymotrypsin/Hap [Thermoleophilia bacterium]
MTRSRLSIPSLPLFLLAAAVVAVLAFGATRWITESRDALPPLSVSGDRAAARPGALDLSKLYEQRIDTTVTIASTINGEPMNGAGVVVDAERGTIVTASHVVFDYYAEPAAAASSVVVRFNRGDEVAAKVEALDQFNDLAILTIDPSELSRPLVAAPIAADSDTVLVGAEVAAIGAPFGFEWSLTPGHVNATHRVVESRINKGYQ